MAERSLGEANESPGRANTSIPSRTRSNFRLKRAAVIRHAIGGNDARLNDCSPRQIHRSQRSSTGFLAISRTTPCEGTVTVVFTPAPLASWYGSSCMHALETSLFKEVKVCFLPEAHGQGALDGHFGCMLHWPEGSGSGATGTLGGRPLRKQAVRVPARRTNTAKIQVVKNTKVWLGKERGAISSRSHRRISGDFRSFAQQERQSQQDPQSECRSQRQSPRPQPEDNAGFGHSGILVF